MPDLHFADVCVIEQAAAVEGDVLKNVVLHGPSSSNHNEYSMAAMRSLVPLLEGRDVYVNHRIGKKMRDVSERFGHVANVRLVESDHDGKPRVRGDLHFLRSHRDSAAIVEAYTKGLPYYGTSLIGDGTGRQENGKRHIENMTRVASLDVVDRAATGSLIEQADAPDAPADPAAMHQQGLDQMVLAIIRGDGSPADKAKKIQTLLETMAPGGDKPANGDATPPMSEATLRKVTGELIEQALTRTLPQLVEQETARRAAAAVYVKPTTPPPAPAAKPAAKDEPPTDPAARKAWLHAN